MVLTIRNNALGGHIIKVREKSIEIPKAAWSNKTVEISFNEVEKTRYLESFYQGINITIFEIRMKSGKEYVLRGYKFVEPSVFTEFREQVK